LGDPDVGHRLRVVVTASNATGSNASRSDASAVVAPRLVAPSSISAPTISGTPRAGSKLTGHPGKWNGTARLSFAYVWERCDGKGSHCAPVGHGLTYSVGRDDVGHRIVLQERARNRVGHRVHPSRATAVVTTAPAARHPTTPSGTNNQPSDPIYVPIPKG
jgi:hypothetical protein